MVAPSARAALARPSLPRGAGLWARRLRSRARLAFPGRQRVAPRASTRRSRRSRSLAKDHGRAAHTARGVVGQGAGVGAGTAVRATVFPEADRDRRARAV